MKFGIFSLKYASKKEDKTRLHLVHFLFNCCFSSAKAEWLSCQWYTGSKAVVHIILKELQISNACKCIKELGNIGNRDISICVQIGINHRLKCLIAGKDIQEL